ncbi:uncharacterized protein LOC127715641 isoform X3 [Mytilus californianus]|uniref:uncharacterized protein LOC127715641 isoform X3 n=1 Tax=Mytilus californianus TaxID=6549 RepID=UPI0022459988|nr:uncharacterized protein LOC127715641 isoform X3 [Mytilus californianus]
MKLKCDLGIFSIEAANDDRAPKSASGRVKNGINMGEGSSKYPILSKKFPKLNKLNEIFKAYNTDYQKVLDEFLTEQEKTNAENKDLKNEIEKLRKYNTQLQQTKSNEQNNISKPKLYRASSVDGKLISECLDRQTNLETQVKSLQEHQEILNQEIDKHKREAHILSSEKESALSRLSKIAGIQLTKGNSEIADLSDANRPTKLGEKWSSLYTDEWSEAYDEITMKRTIKNENCRVEKELFEIAKKCYTTCVELEQKQMTDIKKHAWDIACCLHQQPDQLVEAAQTTLYFKMEEDKKAATHVPNQKANAEDMLKLLAIQKCMEELIQIVHERRKYDKKLLEYVMQKTVKQFERYRKSGSPNHVINFVKRCTELCWSMVIKEPSMVLIYDQLEGKPIDKNLFSPYTKNGSVIDFVVWPALILHKTGPILQKGSVQGKDVPVLADTQQKTDSRMANSLAETSTDGSATFIVRDSTKGGDDIKVFIPPNGANQSVKMTDGGRNEQ